jgi:hypothetical protein
MYLTKKIITASFLLLLLAIPVFFSVTILLQQKILHYQREERMSKEMLLTITVSSHDIFWVKKGKEILFDGKLFDVKSFKTEGNNILLTGYFDNKEDLLVEQIVKLTRYKNHSGPLYDEHVINFLFFPVYISHPIINSGESNWKLMLTKYFLYTSMLPIAPARSLLHPPC